VGHPLPHPLEPLPATPGHGKEPGGGVSAVDHHRRSSAVVTSRGLRAVAVAALHLAGAGFFFWPPPTPLPLGAAPAHGPLDARKAPRWPASRPSALPFIRRDSGLLWGEG
jgi:hypothetical protein